MPSPIGHTLAGCCFAVAAADRSPMLRRPMFGAALLVAANIPDLDFLGQFVATSASGLHQGGTHSVAFVLIAAAVLALLARGTIPLLQAWGWLAAAGLAHLGLDLVNYDSLLPIGIPLAWPFSDARWHSPVALFPGTDRSRPISGTNLRELAAELAWLLPPLAFLLRGRIAAIFRRGGPDATGPVCPPETQRDAR